MSSYSAWLVFLLLFALTKDSSQTRAAGAGAAEFWRHRVARPVVQQGRERRHITTTRHKNGLHKDWLEVSVEAGPGDARYVLELRLNRHLLPRNHTLAYERDGRVVRHTPTPEEAELCQYQGRIRGVEGSWAAVSTCRGLRGVIYDGTQLHYIEPAGGELAAPHYMYRHSELVGSRECGYRGGVTNNTHFDPHLHRLYSRRHEHQTPTRRKRWAEGGVGPALHGPFNANKMSRYVELALVVDHAGYRDSGHNLRAIHAECKDIANIINAMYAPLNIFIALVYVEVWVEGDKILLVDKGDDTLTNFLQYRRAGLLLQHPNDNAQLLTRHRFENGVVGKALKGTMCTYEYSGGINTNHSDVVGLVATTIAHEMGHNFGMEHDSEEDCQCPDKKCIMSPSSNSVSPVHWSSCSQEALALAFEHGLDYCLRNRPGELFESPTCGNGFVEAGEECDCGPGAGAGAGACAACCHADTCVLRRNATCATGPCCDLTRCGVRAAGSVCREATQECDLPEYCTGHSEFCPRDVHKMNTLPCDNRQAYCYEGSCRSHTDQCRLLWGSSGTQSHEKCYGMNKNGSRHGNCGYDRPRKYYEKCAPEDTLCGMLHCRHLNEQLEFGVESVSTLSHTFININGTIIPCRTALVDLGLNQVDPGLVPNGAKCGQHKMCENQKCVSVEAVRARLLDAPASVCPSDCSGHGVCNSKGRCHCERGFAPPLCELPGPGGSTDSGPASNPNVQRNFMVAMYVMFLGVIPSVLLLLLLSYYSRHNLLLWWKRPRKPSQSPKKGSLQRRLSRGASKLAANFQPSHPHQHAAAPPRPAADDMSSSLLRSDSDSSPPAHHLNPANFFGHFKGFSLAPLDKAPAQDVPAVSVIGGFAHDNAFDATDRSAKIVPIHKNGSQTLTNGKGPVRSAPPVPVVPAPAPADRPSSPKLGLRRNNSSVQSRIKALMGDKSDTTAAYINNVPTPRPTISSPILEASTCTAKELISPLQGSKTLGPVRPAPGVPPVTDLPKRPLSMETNVFLKPLPEEPVQKKVKEGISLNRIASFLKQDKSRNPVERSHSLPKNQNQLKPVDKTVLRNLQISNPILQKEIELPVNTVPVVSDSEDADDSKQFVNRAQSMRGPSVTQRPNIPNFGSMRQPSGAARPLSVVLGCRPTSPPPPRPSLLHPASVQGLAGYQNPAVKSIGTDVKSPEYVDCVGEKQAPLADINEESPGDNIYAVIEENPLARAARVPAAPVRTIAQAPPAGYNTPKPIGGSNSGSSESVGLLGEIVSEIQTRNLDSIYSTSTLARRKREREEREKKLRGHIAAADDENDNTTYANTESEYDHAPAPSTTSSGYLHPSAVNVPRFLNNNSTAAAQADKPSSPVAPRGPNSKIPTLGRQLTPPGLRTQTSFRNAPSSPKSAPKLKSNSPDVVSSCAIGGDVKTGKSPDVVNSNANKPPAGDALKPAPRAPVPPKPAEKPSAKSAPSVDKKNIATKSNPLSKTVSSAVEQKIGSVQKIQTERSNPKIIPKLDQTKSAEVNKGKPKPVPKPQSAGAGGRERSAAARLASRPSNVASLQQKFENRKSVGKDAPAAAARK